MNEYYSAMAVAALWCIAANTNKSCFSGFLYGMSIGTVLVALFKGMF